MYNHAEFYAYHPRYKEEWKSSGCSFRKEGSIFTASLSEETTLKYYDLVNKATDDRRMCVKKEAEFICSLGESVVLTFEPKSFEFLRKKWKSDIKISVQKFSEMQFPPIWSTSFSKFSGGAYPPSGTKISLRRCAPLRNFCILLGIYSYFGAGSAPDYVLSEVQQYGEFEGYEGEVYKPKAASKWKDNFK